MRKVRSQTKVIATIGPASSSKEVLLRLIEEGVDVIRLNMSHSNQQEHLNVINLVNKINADYGLNIGLLADLQGPKIRIGTVENNSIFINEGDRLELVTYSCIGNSKRMFVNFPTLPNDVKKGDIILIDDGKIKLEVADTNNIDTIITRVIYGGEVLSKKGVNLPDSKLSLPSMTEEDKRNAIFVIQNNVDWIALSFVRKAEDIIDLKKFISENNGTVSVIAKIEKPEAVSDLERIIEVADAVMVARGDLGVEISFDKVPLLQKKIVNLCISKAKPVIIATQMMESMINYFRPTRAEANDVANAVFDSADALMLSAETSIGKFPVETIKSMQQIIDWTENNGFPYNKEHAPKEDSEHFLAESICYQACKTAYQTNAKAIITFTHSGYTAFKISSHRPEADIFAFTNNKSLLRKMSMVWGVRAFFCNDFDNIDTAISYSTEILKSIGLINNGDIIVHVGSTPLNLKGSTNMIKISKVY